MFFGKKKNSANSQNNQSDDRIKVDTSTITTMVGVDTVIEGALKTKSSVRINGTVIGDVRADGVIVLTKTGKIVGTIEADSIIVAGVVEGNMSIRDKVNVEATGEIYGDVITKKFVIDEESIFQGNCIMNRDGKVIPVPPYVKNSDKKDDEASTDDKDDASQDKHDKEDKEEKEKESEEDKDLSEDKEKDDSDEEDEAKEADDKAEEDTEESDKDSEESDEQEEKKSDDTDSSEEHTDDTIIIANINEVEAVEDIPASDGNTNNRNRKKHGKNYVKKSKSLSVEIQGE